MTKTEFDDLDKLLHLLPEAEPEADTAEKVMWQVIKRELDRLWEQRLSIVLLVMSGVLSGLAARQAAIVAESLDTAGFWALVAQDSGWITSDWEGGLAAISEANPLAEIGVLAILVLFIVMALYFLRQSVTLAGSKRKKPSYYQREMRRGTLWFLAVAIIISLAIGYYITQTEKEMATEQGCGLDCEAVW